MGENCESSRWECNKKKKKEWEDHSSKPEGKNETNETKVLVRALVVDGAATMRVKNESTLILTAF